MSESFAPDPQPERRRADASSTGQQRDSLDEEIEAEIADHLAAAAAERARHGEPADQAAHHRRPVWRRGASNDNAGGFTRGTKSCSAPPPSRC